MLKTESPVPKPVFVQMNMFSCLVISFKRILRHKMFKFLSNFDPVEPDMGPSPTENDADPNTHTLHQAAFVEFTFR